MGAVTGSLWELGHTLPVSDSADSGPRGLLAMRQVYVARPSP